jgi:hypothetical protein
MSVTFTPNTPQATQTIASTQPLINNNFLCLDNSVNGFTVDHQTMTDDVNGGKHKQISFNANNIPAAVPSDPFSIIFTKNNAAGHPYPFFLNSQAGLVSNALPFFPDMLTTGTNRSIQFGSIIVNFGSAVSPGPVVFQRTFTNLLALTIGVTGGGPEFAWITTQSSSGFTIANSGGSITIFYIAIGN